MSRVLGVRYLSNLIRMDVNWKLQQSLYTIVITWWLHLWTLGSCPTDTPVIQRGTQIMINRDDWTSSARILPVRLSSTKLVVFEKESCVHPVGHPEVCTSGSALDAVGDEYFACNKAILWVYRVHAGSIQRLFLSRPGKCFACGRPLLIKLAYVPFAFGYFPILNLNRSNFGVKYCCVCA